jgi:hypothetical protein
MIIRGWSDEGLDPLIQLGLVTAGVIILSLAVAFVLVLRGKPKLGLLAGLSFILIAWAISEVWVIGGCDPSEPLACEWTGVGVVTFALLGGAAALTYVALGIGGIAVHRAVTTRAGSDLRASPSRPRSVLWVSSLGISLICTLVVALASNLVNEGRTRGFFVRWHRAEGSSVADAQAALQAGDTVNAQATSGLCALAFHVIGPPGRVVERADFIYCNAATKRQTSYALLEDASYWQWTHSIDSDLSVLLSRIGSTFAGALSGFVLGVRLARRSVIRSA